MYTACETEMRGDRDDAVALIRAAIDDLFSNGLLPAWRLSCSHSLFRGFAGLHPLLLLSLSPRPPNDNRCQS
jgi:hypothetical protein